tara:strand:+ start:2903 stop:4213 length:1311 start_codon:yes stop_codon:yes gene_type:complete
LRLPQWANSVISAGRGLWQGKLNLTDSGTASELSLGNLCKELLSTRGEAMGITIASAVEDAYQQLGGEKKLAFFNLLFEEFSFDSERVRMAIEEFQSSPKLGTSHRLHKATETARIELFRRINIAPKGTETLVRMRADLLLLLKENPHLNEVDADIRYLMDSWFNRGFLKLVEIDWHTPAHILEKLMNYEAVHSMNGWEDLRRRLAADRRCYAFFHPAMQDEPIIFVQVALCRGLADSVQELLNMPEQKELDTQANTAIFYSISDCQRGLKGISLGNFLIKQVVMELRGELPNITQFATLSPIPGFSSWIRKEIESGNITGAKGQLGKSFLAKNELNDSVVSDQDEVDILKLCAEYLYLAKKDEEPKDPVARFHLRNGASIKRLNWAGDTSSKGERQSFGIMVNYHYDLSRVEERHEAFVNGKEISIDTEFSRQLM